MDLWTDQPTPLQDVPVTYRVRAYAQRPNSGRKVLVRDHTVRTIITESYENVIASACVNMLRWINRNDSSYTFVVDNTTRYNSTYRIGEWQWCRDCRTLHNTQAHPHLEKREPKHDG